MEKTFTIKKIAFRLMTAMAALFSLSSTAVAQCDADVISISMTASSGGLFSGTQTFIAPQSGVISAFRFYFSSGVFGSSVNVTFKVYDSSNTVVHQQTVGYSIFTSTFQWRSVSFNNPNLYFAAGAVFKISFEKAALGAFTVGLNDQSAYTDGSFDGSASDLTCVVSMSAAGSLSLSPSTISFGASTVGMRRQDSITVSNPGCYSVSISSASASNSQISVSPSSATVAAGASQTFAVSYTPSGATSLTDSVTFVSNSPAHGNKKFPLNGSGVFQTQATAGRHLTLDGTDDYVVLPNVAALKLTTGTIEAWIKTGASNAAIFSKANEYSLMINGGNIGIYNWGPNAPDQGYRLSSTNVSDGAWHHVAMSFQSGVSNGTLIYVDGVHVYTTTLTRFSNEPDNIFAAVIGNVYSNTANLSLLGSIDEVRLWNTVRTKTQIRENMHLSLAGNESGLRGYWRLDETSGTSSGDGTGNGYTGTYQSSPVTGASAIPLGTGSSKEYTGVTTGNWDFPATETRWLRVSMYDDPFDNTVDLLCTQINGSPNQSPSGSATLLDRYWIIRQFGTPGTFSAHIMPIVASSFTVNGTATPSLYTLYTRAANSTGAWSQAGTHNTNFWSGGQGLDFINVTSFGQFSVGTNDPLPVELVSFTASAHGRNVELKWKTVTEMNNHGFEVERRAIDNWMRSGFVEGNGTSNTSHEYSFTDRSLSAGTYSFRLKQIDRDGGFSYSEEVEITVGQAPEEFTLDQNYPNPFNPTTTITYQLPVNGHVSVTVYDAVGRELMKLVNQVQPAGRYSLRFDGSDLASGIYLVRLISGERSYTRKVMLLK